MKPVYSVPADDAEVQLLIQAGMPLMPPGAVAYPVPLEAGHAFRQLDSRWFEGRLARAGWTIVPQAILVDGVLDLRKNAHGLCYPEARVIAFDPRLCRPALDQLLLHEMIHADTPSASGLSHGPRFYRRLRALLAQGAPVSNEDRTATTRYFRRKRRSLGSRRTGSRTRP
jgi:hypothetical protein